MPYIDYAAGALKNNLKEQVIPGLICPYNILKGIIIGIRSNKIF